MSSGVSPGCVFSSHMADTGSAVDSKPLDSAFMASLLGTMTHSLNSSANHRTSLDGMKGEGKNIALSRVPLFPAIGLGGRFAE